MHLRPIFFILLFTSLNNICTANICADTLNHPKKVDEKKILSAIEEANRLQFKYSILLNIDIESLSDTSLLTFIDSWYGTRYLLGGNSKNGIDCSAFTQTLLKNVYGVNTSRIVDGQYNMCKIIPKNELAVGDLIFFKNNNRPGLSHVGFYLYNNKFIHASSSRGVVIDDLSENYYLKTYRFSGRIK
jgi:hypothetical protein